MNIKRPSSRYFLLELIVNSLFFILAAAVCLNLFAFGYTQSDDSRVLSEASMRAQEAAEIIKASEGDMAMTAQLLGGETTAQGCSVTYDEHWTPGGGAYTLNISSQTDSSDMLSANISIHDLEGEIFSIEVKRFLGDVKEG